MRGRAARDDGRVLISADTDFSGLLARERATAPAILLRRRSAGRRADEIATLLLASLAVVEDDLLAGVVVAFRGNAIRVRRLPLLPL